jgi:hypothetical protein
MGYPFEQDEGRSPAETTECKSEMRHGGNQSVFIDKLFGLADRSPTM